MSASGIQVTQDLSPMRTLVEEWLSALKQTRRGGGITIRFEKGGWENERNVITREAYILLMKEHGERVEATDHGQEITILRKWDAGEGMSAGLHQQLVGNLGIHTAEGLAKASFGPNLELPYHEHRFGFDEQSFNGWHEAEGVGLVDANGDPIASRKRDTP